MYLLSLSLALLLSVSTGAASIERRQRPTYCKTAPSEPGDTCDFFTSNWGLTTGQFAFLNPEVKSDCSAFVAGKTYCVEALKGSPTPSPKPSAPPSPTAPQPTSVTPPRATPVPKQQVPKPVASCNKFYTVKPGDNCWLIARDQAQTQLTTFQEWNPNLGSACSIQPGWPVCIGVSSVPAPKGPQPQLPGTAADCKGYYFVSPGNSCWQIGQQYNLPLETFYRLNPGVHTDCGNLPAGYYVCVEA